MSRAAVLIALLVAAALAGLFFLGNPFGPPPPPAALPAFDPDAVTAVEINDPVAHTRRTIAAGADPRAHPGLWMTLERPDRSRCSRPVDAARLTETLRGLAALKPLGPAPAPNTVSSTTLTLTLPGGPITYEIDPSPLSGRRSIAAGTGTFAVPADAFAAFTGDLNPLLAAAPLRWPSEPTNLRIDRRTPDVADTLILERAGRIWHMKSPVAAPCDKAAVANLLADLGNLRVRTLGPAPDPNRKPAAVIAVAFSADGADAQTLELFGRTGEIEAFHKDGDLSCPLILQPVDLPHLFAGTASLLSRQSLPRPAADAMAVLISSDPLRPAARFRRQTDAWLGEHGALPPTDASMIGLLLTTLAETPAAAVILTPPTNFEELRQVQVVGLGDAALGQFTLGTADAPAAAAAGRTRRILCIRQESVSRFYAVEPDEPLMNWLRSITP